MRHSQAVRLPDEHAHSFAEGDRVMAPSRPGFPAGTVVKLLTQGHVLVRWDGNVLETASHGELDRSDSD
jgi:hypothetical protein